MKRTNGCVLLLVLSAALNSMVLGQSNPQTRSIIVNGQSGRAEVFEQDGRLFADVLALASIARGSVSFRGPNIVLNLPPEGRNETSAGITPNVTAKSAAAPPNPSTLSREFVKTGIEEIASLREWVTTLASAIRGGYGVTDEWVNGYRDQASRNLQLAVAAASTDGDRDASQLLRRVFNLVQQWSDQLVAAKQSMDTAKYTMSPNALREDPLSQTIIACGHFVTQMLGSGTFQDDASCR